MLYATDSRGDKGLGLAQFFTIYVGRKFRDIMIGVEIAVLRQAATLNAALYHTSFRYFQAQGGEMTGGSMPQTASGGGWSRVVAGIDAVQLAGR